MTKKLFQFKQIILLLIVNVMYSQTTINYKLSMPEPQSHIYEVEAQFDNLPKKLKELNFSLPVWRSGRYVVFDFAGDLLTMSVSDSKGKLLKWEKTDKTSWSVELNSSTSINIKYKIFANEFNARTKGLNSDHGFVDPSAIFIYAEEYRSLPLTLIVAPFKNWHVTTGLVEIEKNKFTAPNYDYFTDCPLEIGTQKDFTFMAEGKEHKISIFGEANYNFDTLKKDFSTLISYNKNFWGKLPYDNYTFMFHITPTAGGATEHINSTILGERAANFAKRDIYISSVLGTVSHEYFHTWNVKQLRPKGIAPYDFLKENYTKELWISEGTTSYYDDLILVRTKFKTAKSYTDDIATKVRNDRRRPGNLNQSLSESSFDAWIKFWKSSFHSYNFQSDYYEKGANVSLLLDLEIRKITNNSHSLDNVMKSMFEKFPLEKGGFTVDDFQKNIENLTDHSFILFFENYIHGTKPLPWEEILNNVGLVISVKDSLKEIDLGFTVVDQNGKAIVRNVIINSSAMSAGLDIQDEVIALNGQRVNAKEIIEKITSMNPLTTIKITVFREDKIKEISFQPNYQTTPTYVVAKVKAPTSLQQKTYESWLNTTW